MHFLDVLARTELLILVSNGVPIKNIRKIMNLASQNLKTGKSWAQRVLNLT